MESITTTGWVLIALLAFVLLSVLVGVALFLSRLLVVYVGWIHQLPLLIVIPAFLLFPPAFFAYLLGLIPYGRASDKAAKEFAEQVKANLRARQTTAQSSNAD